MFFILLLQKADSDDLFSADWLHFEFRIRRILMQCCFSEIMNRHLRMII